MPTGLGTIRRSTNNGPFQYVWEVNGSVENAAVGKTLQQAVTEVEALAVALAGTIRKVILVVEST